jgi:DNA-binding GntR family transcriptional regulator
MASTTEMLPLSAERLVRKPLSEEVYRVLRQMIVQGKLQPNDKLYEDRLASVLGVSRTPVREALRRLEHDGLTITRPGFSTRVTTLTVNDIEEIYPLITVLEGLAVRLATPRLSREDLDYLSKAVGMMARCRRGNVVELMAADERFHSLLHERAHNERLHRTVTQLHGQLERFEYVFFSSRQLVRTSIQQHRTLVEELRKRDALAAERAVLAQWEWGRQELLRIIREQKLVPEPRAAISEANIRAIRKTGRKATQ